MAASAERREDCCVPSSLTVTVALVRLTTETGLAVVSE
jgi:hypothetical protein